MNPGKLTALLCLVLTMSSLPCAAELLPGDIALTRIEGSTVAVMAMRNIPAGETIRFTNNKWGRGSFDNSGGAGAINLSSPWLAGTQRVIDLSNSGIALDWKQALHFFQVVTPSHTTQSQVRHLLLVELNQDGLRWLTDIPDGLIPDVTHIAIGEQFTDQGLNHVIREGLLTKSLTPYQWMRAFGSFRAWSRPQDYVSPLDMGQWSEVTLTITPSPGIISLPLLAQNYSEAEGQLYVPVRRSFGSGGPASVKLTATNQVGAFMRSRNHTISGLSMDLTDVAHGPGVGFVAVSPTSGTIMINPTGVEEDWSAVDTNGDSGVNLQLSGIVHDGSNFWACSLDGRIYASGDGQNWEGVFASSKPGAQFLRMHHLPGAGLPLVAVGRDGLCAFSAGGGNWDEPDTGSNADFFGAAFFGGAYVLCGSGGTIIYSANPGSSWNTAFTPTTRTLFSIARVDFGGTPTILAVGQYGQMIQSTALDNEFVNKPSNTEQSLFDIIQTSINEGADNYVFCVGANGAAVVSENGAPFATRRSSPRAPALYALAQYDEDGKNPMVFGVGEYGSLIRFLPAPFDLSGSLNGINLDGAGSSMELGWETGSYGEKYVKLEKGVTLSAFRERIDLKLERPGSPGSNYNLGNDQSEICFFRSTSAPKPPVAQNFGPLLHFTNTQLEVLSNDEWRINFRILNTSNIASKDLYVRFEGTNLPDILIPDGATEFAGNRIGPREHSGLLQPILRQPVETIALYEEFRSGELVLKARVAINSLVADTNWTPNGIFQRSLGAYLEDNGTLEDPGVPGIGILGGGQGAATASTTTTKSTGSKTSAPPPVAHGSGFVFSGTAPTPPDNNPETPELVLLTVTVDGPVGMDVRQSYNYFLVGGFYNTGTGLLDDYSMNTVDWEVTESSLPAAGLSIEDDTGAFDSDAYPGVQYPRAVTIGAVTTEGAPLDGDGVPVEYNDSQGLTISEPASYTTYAEWVAASAMAADEDGEDQDADGDGIANLLEFVLGLNPETPNPFSGTSSSYDAARGEFTFSFTVPNDLSAVTIKILTSEDLSTWTERVATLTGSTASTETWSATVPMGTHGFGVLQAETYTP